MKRTFSPGRRGRDLESIEKRQRKKARERVSFRTRRGLFEREGEKKESRKLTSDPFQQD